MDHRPGRRRATVDDADRAADIWLRSFTTALPTVRPVHTAEQILEWMRRVVIAQQETWVVTIADRVVGLMSLDDDGIDQLYLDPEHRGRGLGDLLVDHAKARRPTGLSLWTFQVNTPAIRFYARHGFDVVERTDGAHNEEREPDVRMEWRPEGRL